jgi:ribosome-binding protein aMBF1 (putative translation factor)
MSARKPSSSETVGARIRALRLAANLTQDEFAAKLDVSRSAIAQWEPVHCKAMSWRWSGCTEPAPLKTAAYSY